eukprot:SAG31_NODE_2123_length_6401_cov_4.982069_7_plen_78_part_00
MLSWDAFMDAPAAGGCGGDWRRLFDLCPTHRLDEHFAQHWRTAPCCTETKQLGRPRRHLLGNGETVAGARRRRCDPS